MDAKVSASVGAEALSDRPERDSGEPGRKGPTLTAVARAAGVSIATVSKVINGRVGVGDGTRARVQAVIHELGYVSPVGKRAGQNPAPGPAVSEVSIEIVVDPLSVSNPYLTLVLVGAMQAAAENGVALVLRSIEAVVDRSPRTWAGQVAQIGRGGVIEVTSAYSAAREAALDAQGLPMVLIDPVDVPRDSTWSIGATNWAGAYAATQHLLGLGHRRIQYLGGPGRARCDVVRAHGWAAAMSEAGLRADLDSVPHGSYTFEHGLAAATQLLGEPPHRRPTAIFAGSDPCAIGALEAARRLGLSVPGDLSVVGFDDSLLAATSTPPLTTVHQPISDMGRTAVTTLLRRIRGEDMATKRIELATRLVVRDTTAAPVHAPGS
ncbi:LacI family DNA-binding transcriptional regulator [Kineosporia babensis]|uniref:LacI family transcriptional regulator n=1 Tax=Kineosporia babensis TaxID=499548 RepID=A0A9X1NQ10_9ACTN|nr:LacI family DNA-binding transcriptional regulator [Kineosporia babensis]MCD5317181.1 LacI family transcriptional regulator [Kineosporia babensis]